MVSNIMRMTGQNQLRGNVLVVEDTKDLGLNITDILDRRGLKAKWAKTGTHALKICKSAPIDIVVLDYQGIGRLDGIEVARQLQQNHPSIRVVAHTAFGNTYRPQAAQLGLQNIAEWIYKKPKSIEVVIEKVFELLNETFEDRAQQFVHSQNLSTSPSKQNKNLDEYSKHQIRIVSRLKQMLTELGQPEITNDLQQKQIQVSQFKNGIRDSLWRVFSTSPVPQRNLVHMLKAATKHIDVNISIEQISAVDYVLSLLESPELHLGVLHIAKSRLQSVKLDPILRVGEQLESLKQLYQLSGLDIEDLSEG